MPRPRAPRPVRFFAALSGVDTDLVRRARHLLTKRWGPLDLETEPRRTPDVGAESTPAGEPVFRSLLGFAEPQPVGRLVELAIETAGVEQQISEDCLLPGPGGEPPVNAISGYVDAFKVVLGQLADGASRVALGAGVFGEIVLQRSAGGWKPLPWSSSDWSAPESLRFLDELHGRLLRAADGVAAAFPDDAGTP